MVSKRKNNECKSSYELQREKNIQRNEMFLISLGIENIEPKLKKSPVKRVKNEKIVIDLVPERRSKRYLPVSETKLVQLGDNGDVVESKIGFKKPKKAYDPNVVKVDNVDNFDYVSDDNNVQRIKITNSSLRDFINEKNPTHSSEISDEQLSHCVMRIRSMTTKALGTRIKMIATARGNSHYEKLLVFYYGLKATGFGIGTISNFIQLILVLLEHTRAHIISSDNAEVKADGEIFVADLLHQLEEYNNNNPSRQYKIS